jgi:HD superfamily phosphodiesterase
LNIEVVFTSEEDEELVAADNDGSLKFAPLSWEAVELIKEQEEEVVVEDEEESGEALRRNTSFPVDKEVAVLWFANFNFFGE